MTKPPDLSVWNILLFQKLRKGDFWSLLSEPISGLSSYHWSVALIDIWVHSVDRWRDTALSIKGRKVEWNLLEDLWEILCEDNTILWILELRSCVSVRWCFIELVWWLKSKTSSSFWVRNQNVTTTRVSAFWYRLKTWMPSYTFRIVNQIIGIF